MLARLIVARGRVVPVATLVDDLGCSVGRACGRSWARCARRSSPGGRRGRAPRLLITEGPGYALRTDAVDAWRFEAALDDPATGSRWR